MELLRGKTGARSGPFYFALGNIPLLQRSKQSLTPLVTILKEKNLKKYGMDAILKPIVHDIQNHS